MTQDVWAFVDERIQAGEQLALLTVTETRGSSPATPGQVMAVAADGQTAGTIGGGPSEYALQQRALEAMRQGEDVFSFAIDHAESGMVCGGGMKGFGNVLGTQARLVLFGGGHVAQHLAPLARGTGFAVAVVEDRADLEASFDDAQFIHATADAYPEKIPLRATDYIVICTRGHKSDNDALHYCLGKPTAYLGMIGSRRKVQTLFDKLRAEGVDEDTLRRVYAPIGLAIATGTPAEIAISILAEMLLVKNHGRAGHLRDGGTDG